MALVFGLGIDDSCSGKRVVVGGKAQEIVRWLKEHAEVGSSIGNLLEVNIDRFGGFLTAFSINFEGLTSWVDELISFTIRSETAFSGILKA